MSIVPVHEEIELEEGRSNMRRTFNPLGQNPSPHPERDSEAFNFELPSPSSERGFGDSFMNMNDFDRWNERR